MLPVTESTVQPVLPQERRLRGIILAPVLLNLGKTILFASVGEVPLVGDADHYWGCRSVWPAGIG